MEMFTRLKIYVVVLFIFQKRGLGFGEPQKPGPEAVMTLLFSTYWSVIKELSHFKMTSKAPNCAVLALLNFVNGLTLLLAGDWHTKYSRICE